MQSSFSNNIKFSEELAASVPRVEANFILVLEAAPYCESLQLSVIFHGVTIKKFIISTKNKWSYTETFWKTNEQRNKVKNSQHYS